jgi:hypothetical protein
MMNKSLRARGRKSSRKHIYGFQHPVRRAAMRRFRHRTGTCRNRSGKLMALPLSFGGDRICSEQTAKGGANAAQKRAAVSGGF